MAGRFSIAGSSRSEAHVVVAAIHEGNHVGRGESVPLARNGESVPDTIAAIRAMAPAIAGSLDRVTLRAAMPPGSARNAIDCALFDLEAKQAGTSAAAIIGLPSPGPVETAFTLSLDAPEAMAKAAGAAAFRPLLKVKLGGAGDPARIAAVRAAAPGVRLIADANQAWSTQDFEENMAACVAAGVELVEQPLPVGADAPLSVLPRPIPICADESIRTVDDLDALVGRYDAVNIKLDKAGGLTEALALLAEARRRGLAIMVGCMVGTSLAMAPALLLAQSADYVDLDGPLLLARDRVPGLRYEGSVVYPPEPALWG